MNASAPETVGDLYRKANKRGNAIPSVTSAELRDFFSDVRDLLRKISNISDADVTRLRARVESTLADVQEAVGVSAGSLRERARAAADSADDYVRGRPWTAIGMAAAAGAVLGVLLAAIAGRR